MRDTLAIAMLALAAAAGGFLPQEATAQSFARSMLAAKFDYLSKNGNSSCSAAFSAAIASLPAEARLRGSCCSPMSLHRYVEQIEGLRKFKAAAGQNLAAIPDDPYDLEAGLAKKLQSYYEMKLTPAQQARYDYAMKNSDEKGPCCCPCWRWQVYGGLAKLLIRHHGFSGEQVSRLWDLSDGCGGEADHVGHS
jgi:hypothetical protein